MTDELEKYLMEPTPFELAVDEVAEKIKEYQALLTSYQNLKKMSIGTVKAAYDLDPRNPAEILGIYQIYKSMSTGYVELLSHIGKGQKIEVNGRKIKFDPQGIAIIGYRLRWLDEVFKNWGQSPIYSKRLIEYRDNVVNEFIDKYCPK